MAPSGAGAVVTILFLLMCSSLACGLEIVEPPRDTTVFLDHSAVFVCGTRDALYGYWRVNGTAYNYLPPAIRADLDADQETVGDIEVYTLTIPGRAEYNGTEVQCVAGDDGGGTIESAIATLKVQGLLASVGNLEAENSSTSITISWTAPFSLDVSGEDPDILYTVLISNVTDEDHPTAVPCTDCHNLTQTHYTFSPDLPSPCHNYTFTVIPWNGAGPGESRQPVIGEFNSGANFSIKEAYARWKPDTEKGDEVTLKNVDGWQDVCSYRIFMDPIMEPISRVRSEGNDLVFKAGRLPRDEEYIVIIEATTSRSVTNSTLKLSTHDVQFAVAKPISGGVKIKGELAENTNAIGCFFVVRCQTDDPENYAISQKNPDGTCSTTVPDLKANNYTINVYDMESNAQPGSTPAVPLNVSVTNSGGSSGTPKSSSVVTDAVQRSNGSFVKITCEFNSTLQDDDLACIIIWHKKGNNTLNSTMQHMGDAPSVIETEAEEEYSFVVFGKKGDAIDPYPVVPEEMHKAPGQDNIGAEVVGVIVVVIVCNTTVFAVVIVILVIKRKCSVRGNHNIKRQSLNDSLTSGLIHKEKESHCGSIKADGDNQSQAQVVLDMEMMTKETDTITNEGEESKYASILISTPGIRSPTVEKPVHYGQIDLDATKRKAHPQGLLYADVAPAPEGHGPKPNKMVDDPNTRYAIILPHATSPTGSPNTESKQKVPKEGAMPKEPLTEEAVMTLLRCVARRWKEIADGFGIDEDLVDEIFTNNERDEACLQDCVEQWMKLGPTWKKLANVLRGMGEERLAGQAASKELPDLQRQSCNEKLPAESTDEGFVQEGMSESGSSDDSAFVPSTNNSGQIPAVQQDSDHRGSKVVSLQFPHNRVPKSQQSLPDQHAESAISQRGFRVPLI